MHIVGALEAFVVEGNVSIEQLINRPCVGWVFLPSLDHFLGAEVYQISTILFQDAETLPTSQIRVVDLDVSSTSIVQDLQLCPVSLRYIVEVLFICRIDVFRVGSAFFVPQVIPVRSCLSRISTKFRTCC